MNWFLMIYLTFIRGPRILEERRQKEEEERKTEEAKEFPNGRPKITCKKCDGEIGTEFAKRNPDKCKKCVIAAYKALHPEQELEIQLQMTPFLWFQVFMICLALSVFFYRNFIMPFLA